MLLTLLHPQVARDFYESGFWREETFYSLLEKHVQASPETICLRDSQHSLTWRQLLLWVDSFAFGLQELGLKPTDRVAVWLPSRVESIVSFLACSRNGYVCCPSLHQNYTTAEIAQLLNNCGAKALVAQKDYGIDANRHQLLEHKDQLGSLKAIYLVTSSDLKQSKETATKHFPSPLEQQFPELPTTKLTCVQNQLKPALKDPEAIVYLAFTSGTTGRPKGVMHSNNTLLANGRAMVNDWSYPRGTVMLSLSPLSHHIGTVAVSQWLVGGFQLVLNDPSKKISTTDWLIETNTNYAVGVPTHAIDILATMKSRGLNRLGRVSIFYMAGSLIPHEVGRQLLSFGIKPQNVYGMTENGSHQYTLPSDDLESIVQTCGRAAAGYETRIVDQHNPDFYLPDGEIGEIATRGALLMLGYFGNQVATESSFNSDGWFLSGDLGQLDSKGRLRIMGRKKELIIRGGHNIFPSRIEDLAHQIPNILKVAVFALPDERLGEKVCLAVIFRVQQEMSADALLLELFKMGLSKLDMPEYFTSLSSFPMTASGKTLKRTLKELCVRGEVEVTPVRFVEPK
jgi:acyl-CoA synthetase